MSPLLEGSEMAVHIQLCNMALPGHLFMMEFPEFWSEAGSFLKQRSWGGGSLMLSVDCWGSTSALRSNYLKNKRLQYHHLNCFLYRTVIVYFGIVQLLQNVRAKQFKVVSNVLLIILWIRLSKQFSISLISCFVL